MAGARRRVRTMADIQKEQPKDREIDRVLAEIRKKGGPNAAVTGSERIQPYRIPTGIFTLDYALLGGIPHNRVTMFHGRRSSGKTTAALRAAAGAQASLPDQQVAVVDVEGTTDAVWAGKIGVDTGELQIVEPETGEQAVDYAEALCRTREISLVIIDSIAALVPMKEIEDSAEDAQVGLQSRLVGKMVRKLNAALIAERQRGHFVSILFLNQQRTKIGGWSPTGDPISLPGGKALEFCTSVQVQFKNKENVKKDDAGFDTLHTNDHAFTIDKNKLNAGIRSGEFRMMRRDDDERGLSEGDIDDAGTMLAFAKKLGWYTGAGKGQTLEFGDVSQKFSNIADAEMYLYENRDIHWALRCHLIADAARRAKMKPEFVSYLLGE